MSAKAHYMEGLKLVASGDDEAAIEAFEGALNQDADFFLAHLGMTTVLDRLGRVDDAIAHARKAIDLSPEEALAHTSLSRLLQQKGLIDEAEAEMAISLRLQKEAT